MHIIVTATVIHTSPIRHLGPVIPAVGRFINIQAANIQCIGVIGIDTCCQGMPADGSPMVIPAGGHRFGSPCEPCIV